MRSVHERRSRRARGRLLGLMALLAAVCATVPGSAAVAQGAGDTVPALDGPATVEPSVSYPYSFAVVGHIRGPEDGRLHYLLDDLLAELEREDPEFMVLTGDLIWGDVNSDTTDPDRIRDQWQDLDSALARLDIPIYRVPGNHDITDVPSRRVYEERYGAASRMVNVGPARLLLYGSGFIPEADDTRKHVFIRGVQPESAQVAWISEQLREADERGAGQTFLFMHHLLWWAEPDASWWQEVHPALVDHGVRAVFSGDWGPMKFSHLRRDGIDYYQSSIAPEPAPEVLDHLRGHEWNRLLAGQFDNFLMVRVAGPDSVSVEVRTLGETASEAFTPDLWRQVHGGIQPPPPPTGRDHLRAVWEFPKGKAFLLGLPVFGLLIGLGLGWVIRRR
jgi:hypothetical protein